MQKTHFYISTRARKQQYDDKHLAQQRPTAHCLQKPSNLYTISIQKMNILHKKVSSFYVLSTSFLRNRYTKVQECIN